jgi:hypothetical protein
MQASRVYYVYFTGIKFPGSTNAVELEISNASENHPRRGALFQVDLPSLLMNSQQVPAKPRQSPHDILAGRINV